MNSRLRPERPQPRQPDFVDDLPDDVALGSRRQGDVHHVLRRVVRAGVRIERVLEEARHQHPFVVREDVLGPVAVMHVEVDDRDPFEPMDLERMERPDRNVVEEAEAHRGRLARVVPGRAHRAERVREFLAHHAVGGVDHRAGRAQGRLPGVRVHRRVRVDGPVSLLWYAGFQPFDVRRVVRSDERFERRCRRIVMFQVRRDPNGNQVVVNRGQALRRLRVPRSHLVFRAGAVGEEPGMQHLSPFGPLFSAAFVWRLISQC